VAGDDVLELRKEVLRHEARLVPKPERVVPLVERVVEAHLETLAADGTGEVAQEVAPGADLDGVPGTAPGGRGLSARPEGEALVMLRGEDDVFRARGLEHRSPVIGIEELGLELGGEVLIRELGAVLALVVLPRSRLDGGGLVAL